MLPPPTMAPPRHAIKKIAPSLPKRSHQSGRPLVRSVEIISAERTMHHPHQSSAKNVAETNVQTACHHTDRRRGAQSVQLSYSSQKPKIYIKTLQTYRCIHPREHTTNDYIQFIITIFYMNIHVDKMYRPAPQTHADPNPTYSGMRS